MTSRQHDDFPGSIKGTCAICFDNSVNGSCGLQICLLVIFHLWPLLVLSSPWVSVGRAISTVAQTCRNPVLFQYDPKLSVFLRIKGRKRSQRWIQNGLQNAGQSTGTDFLLCDNIRGYIKFGVEEESPPLSL